MSDLGSIVRKNGESVNLNLLPISTLKEMLKDTNQEKKGVVEAINNAFSEKREPSQEITQVSLTEEELLTGELVVKGRVGMGSVSDVVRGIESFKLTVMEEIRKRFNGKEKTPNKELEQIDEGQMKEEDREI